MFFHAIKNALTPALHWALYSPVTVIGNLEINKKT
jgi:hypothetical protein